MAYQCPYCKIDLDELESPFTFVPMQIAGRKATEMFTATHRCPKCKLVFNKNDKDLNDS